jgi:hypothetical protein
MIVDMSPGHRISPSKGGATWQVTITKSAIPKEKTLAGVCLSLLGASPLVPTDTPPPFSSRLSRCSHLDCRAAVRLVSALQNIGAEKLASGDEIDADVLVSSDDAEAANDVQAILTELGMRSWHVGPLANSAAAEALTSVLIQLNRRYKLVQAGIRITGKVKDAS